LGFQKTRPSQLNLSPSDGNLGGRNVVSDNVVTLDDDRTAMSEVRDALIFEPLRKINSVLTQSEIPNTGSSRNSNRRKMFGRPFESNGSPTHGDGENGKGTVSTPISFTSTKRDSIEESTPPKTHRRSKRSLDNNKPSDRLSLFGGTFGGSIGKSRKPPPRYSAGYVFIESRTPVRTNGSESNRSTDREDDGASGKGERDKSASTFSRLYHMGDRKPSISKHNVVEIGARQAALDKAKSTADALAKAKEDKDRTLLRKRTSGGEATKSPVPVPPSNGSGLVQGRSVLEQIGAPDFNGWLMKKGEHYNTWKSRYCVLKGHNLYWMRSNSTTVRTNSSGISPGAEADSKFRRRGSRDISTFLVIGSPPTRISSPEIMVSEWNIRTTRLICSIRTPNPSSANG